MRVNRFPVTVAAVLLTLGVASAGCAPFAGPTPSPSTPPGPVESLSDDGARKEVVDPGRQIVKVANLQGASGNFSFEACNDQGEPPYRGRLDVTFAVPGDVAPEAYFTPLAQTVVAQGRGWYDGPPAGKNLAATTIHTDEVFANIGRHGVAPEKGTVTVFGECRNMVNHRDDPVKDFNVTADLTGL